MSYAIENKIKIKWYINGIDSYCFGEDKQLYNLKTNRKKKQCYNNRSIGYWIGKEFYSLNKLKKLLYKKKEKDYCPF